MSSRVSISRARSRECAGYTEFKASRWLGVAHYVSGSPHLIRSSETALGDALFHRVSGVVASETVVAHVRQATQGKTVYSTATPSSMDDGCLPTMETSKILTRLERATVYPKYRRDILGNRQRSRVLHLSVSVVRKWCPSTGIPRSGMP